MMKRLKIGLAVLLTAVLTLSVFGTALAEMHELYPYLGKSSDKIEREQGEFTFGEDLTIGGAGMMGTVWNTENYCYLTYTIGNNVVRIEVVDTPRGEPGNYTLAGVYYGMDSDTAIDMLASYVLRIDEYACFDEDYGFFSAEFTSADGYPTIIRLEIENSRVVLITASVL